MDAADLISAAVTGVLAAGLLWFRYRTNRTVGTACVMLGLFLIFGGLCKIVLSGLYGDFAGYLVIALGVLTVVFRRRWNLLLVGAALCLFGVLNVASVVLTRTHPTLVVWGIVQVTIAAVLVTIRRSERKPA